MLREIKRFVNPVSVVIVTVLLVLFLNRQALFSNQAEPREVEQLLDRVDRVVERMNRVEPGEHPDGDNVSLTAGPPDKATPSTPAVHDAQPEHGKKQAVEKLPQMRPVQSKKEHSQPQAEEEPESTSANAQPGQDHELTSGTTIADSSANGGTAEAAPADKELLSLWMEARHAAWSGRPNKAVAHYRELIAVQPDNYDAHGELGNVLLQLGDTAGAVEAYARSSLLLSRFGHQQAAWYLLGVVSRLDREKAQSLYQELHSRAATPIE